MTNKSFIVNWTIVNPNNIYNYIITWTNLRTGVLDNVTVSQNIFSRMITGLNGIDNYNVSVIAYNPCGMIISDILTVYGKNVSLYMICYNHIIITY